MELEKAISQRIGVSTRTACRIIRDDSVWFTEQDGAVSTESRPPQHYTREEKGGLLFLQLNAVETEAE
jgi:hypothetical protein